MRDFVFQAMGRTLRCDDRPLIMGVVNATPDSFYAESRCLDPVAAAERCRRMVEEGADLLDVGAESTRPGARPIDVDEELRRVVPIVEAVAKAVQVPISVDTMKASVARAALDAGATIVNDVSALRHDPAMATLVAETRCGLVLMHMQGTPETMQRDPRYTDVVRDVAEFFAERLRYAEGSGISPWQIVLDPGIGFGKLVLHNLELLSGIKTFTMFQRPILVGVSRKGFIGQLLDRPVDDRLFGTAAAVALAVERGAHILRVHDVRAMADVALVASAIARHRVPPSRVSHA